MLNNFKMKFMRFMQGRNGVDQFSQFLNVVVIILFAISIFIRWTPIYWSAIALFIYMYFRIFSKNIAKRSMENQKFCNMRYDFAVKKNKWKKEWEQRKIYRFFRCPMCHQKVRVPKSSSQYSVSEHSLRAICNLATKSALP